jgi:hypothetical protein
MSEKKSPPDSISPSPEPGPDWLISPGTVPAGVKLSFNATLGAREITHDVLKSLGEVADEIQRTKIVIPPFCPKLIECGTFHDPGTGCGGLQKCGTYDVVVIWT